MKKETNTKVTELSGLRKVGAASKLTLSKKARPGDGTFGNGLKGCGPYFC